MNSPYTCTRTSPVGASRRFNNNQPTAIMIKTTAQMTEWSGDFGRAYTDRNTLSPDEMDALWRRNFGKTRSELNKRFLGEMDRSIRILEVGCNVGNQLLSLQQMGFRNLY